MKQQQRAIQNAKLQKPGLWISNVIPAIRTTKLHKQVSSTKRQSPAIPMTKLRCRRVADNRSTKDETAAIYMQMTKLIPVVKKWRSCGRLIEAIIKEGAETCYC
jgi:hypothetical protein